MNQSLENMIAQSKRIVFFGGAGVSTESGVKDFRSPDGLYSQSYDVPPETILSRSFFLRDPETFYRFYREKMLVLDVHPNAAHRRLAELEREGKLTAVITQNIDGLHQAAGSKRVLELHGSIHRNYCRRCGAFFDAEFIKNSTGVPHCPCGGVVKPDVVLYEEPLNRRVLEEAVAAIEEADMLIVGGTSLVVWPAAALVDYYRGSRLVLINREPTRVSERADLAITDSIGAVLGRKQA